MFYNPTTQQPNNPTTQQPNNLATIPYIAVINQTTDKTDQEVALAVAAIQIQVSRDLKSTWGYDAVLGTYNKDETTYTKYTIGQGYSQIVNSPIPADAWHVYFKNTIDEDLAGYHITTNGKPVGYLKDSDIFLTVFDDWTVIMSHEILEMLANPQVDRYITGLLDDDGSGGVGGAEMIVEICDPCQSYVYYINIDGKDIGVSNFVFTSYYNDRVAIPYKQYDFMGTVKTPRSLNNGGYFSFKKAQAWYQSVRQNFITITSKLGDNQSLDTNQNIELLLFIAGIAIIGGSLVWAASWFNKRKTQ